MAVIETWLHQDLQEPVKVNHLDGNLFSNNGNGNRIGVVLTNNGENLASISGTVSGYVVTADGSTVPCTGSKSGNRASILIPAAAYQPGSIFITVFVTDGTTVTTVGAVSSNVMRSRTNEQVDPGSVVTDWTQTINAAMQSVETAAENLGGIVAVPYASITFPVPLGKYTYYNNNLYRCITPIASSESFTAAHWTQVRLGDDVSDLKSAFNLVADGDHIYGFVQGARSQTTPTVVNANNARVTTDEAIFLRKNDLLSVTGTYTGIKYTIIGYDGATIYQKAFGTGDYTLIAPFDGAYFVNVAKTDGTSAIIPSEATITVKATNKNHKILELHDGIINDNLMGIDPPENLYKGADTWGGSWNATSASNVSSAGEFHGYPVLYLNGTWQRYFKNITVESGKTYTFSVWVKAPTTTSIIVYITHTGTAATAATVSPTNKSYNNVVSANTWTKLSVTFTCSASGNVSPHVITGYGAGLYIAKYMLCEGTTAFSLMDELNNRATLSDVSGIGDYRKYSFTRPTSESGDRWNPEIVKAIPQGTKVKIIFDSYSGQYLTQMRIDGKKSNNTYDDGIASLSNPLHGGEVEFTASTAYTALRVQFAQSTAETGITASVYLAATDELGITNDLLSMNASRVFTVKKDGSGDFTKLVDAVQFACQFMDSVVYIGEGEYDIIGEFGATYMAAVDSSHNWGMELKNRVHLIGSARTVIKAFNVEEGNNNFSNIKTYFSVFNAGKYGFTIENLTIIDDSIRYSVHDDLGTAGNTPYHNRYLNCSMTHTNGMYPDCIGAGIGEDGYIEIRGCYFDGDTTRSGNPVTRYVYWHGNNNSSVTTAKGRIFLTDNYFCKTGAFHLMRYGYSTTKTIAYMSNNSFGSEPTIMNPPNPDTHYEDNMEMVKWNNTVRS